jgi:Domain of unknown function (DUF4345)
VSRKALQLVLSALGAVATAAGARGMVQGAAEVVDAGSYSSNVDSEYRFYAAWYHVAGLVLLRAARQPEDATVAVRLFSGGLFAAGCARLLSARTVGSPHRLQRLLMGLEFAIPVVLIPWQRQVAVTANRGGFDRNGART